MDHARQVALIRRIFDHLDTRTTTMAGAVYENPVADYTCPDQAAAEARTLFRRRPIVLGLSADLPEPGDYVTCDGTGVPVLAVRGRDGEVRAFANVCRHRGARIAEGRGHVRRAFTCPYHGWSYGLDGALAGQPEPEGFEDVDRDCLGLKPLPAAERYGLVWARPEGDAPVDPDRELSGLERELAPLALDGFHPFRTETRRLGMNWKLVLDTFLETYHFPVLHKETLRDIFVPNCGPFDAYGENLRIVGVRRSIEALREAPEAEWDALPHTTLVHVIFPNTVLVMQAGHVELWRLFPGADPNESTFELALYAPEPPETEKAERHWQANLDLVLGVTETEDFVVGAEAQRGFASGAQDRILFGRNEPGLQHFHKTVRAALEAD